LSYVLRVLLTSQRYVDDLDLFAWSPRYVKRLAKSGVLIP
jgi:hypothetical protein